MPKSLIVVDDPTEVSAKTLAAPSTPFVGPHEELAFIQDLDKALGHASLKATAWLGQREAMLEQLIAVRDKADSLIRALSGTNASSVSEDHQLEPVRRAPVKNRGRSGRPVPPSKQRKRSRPPLSAEARARIGAAQKVRWAKLRALMKANPHITEGPGWDQGHLERFAGLPGPASHEQFASTVRK